MSLLGHGPHSALQLANYRDGQTVAAFGVIIILIETIRDRLAVWMMTSFNIIHHYYESHVLRIEKLNLSCSQFPHDRIVLDCDTFITFNVPSQIPSYWLLLAMQKGK